MALPGCGTPAQRFTFARMRRHEDRRPRGPSSTRQAPGATPPCLTTATAHTAGSGQHARSRSTPALANLHCAPRQRILITPSDHLNNQKLSIRMWRAFLAALWLMPDAHAALAQAQTPAWPSKPVRISVPVTAGSAIDLVCRTVFDQVSQQVGQPFIIDNRGGGTLAPAAVAKADPAATRCSPTHPR